MTDINREIAGCLDESEVLRRSLNLETDIVDAETGSILLLDDSGEYLHFAVSLGDHETLLKEHRIEVGEGIAGRVAERGEPLLIKDADADERVEEYFDEQTGFETESLICAPIQTGEKILGVAEVLNKTDGSSFDREDLMLFSAFAGQVAVALENARLHEEVLSRQEMIQEAKTARKVQESYLPDGFPDRGGLNFAGRLTTAREVSGDFYDCFELAGGRVAFVIGDVSGKGMPAALYMCRVLTELRTRLTYEPDAEQLLDGLNDRLVESSTEGMFVTLLLFVIDPAEDSVRVRNAGHLPFWQIGEGSIRLHNRDDNPPLGIQPDFDFTTYELQLAEGDRIVALTDGVTEATNPEGEPFGLRRVQSELERTRLPGDLVVEKMFRDVEWFSDSNRQDDDRTVVAFESPGDREEFSFEVRSHTDYLPLVRKASRRLLQESGVKSDAENRLVVGLEEAVSNIIEHTYHHRKSGRIQVTLTAVDGTFTVVLRDFGEPVDLENQQGSEPDPDDPEPGGLGLRLMRDIYDEVRQDSSVDEGNRLILRKDLCPDD